MLPDPVEDHKPVALAKSTPLSASGVFARWTAVTPPLACISEPAGPALTLTPQQLHG